MTKVLPESTLSVEPQIKKLQKELPNGDVVVVTIRWDDYRLGNKHNSFSVTCDVYDRGYIAGEAFVTNSKGRKRYLGSCGQQHELVEQHFPEISHLIKWHLVGSDGPMHYIANTTYHAQNGNLDAARKTAVWPEATIDQLMDSDALLQRLPELMERFKKDIESLGFTY